MIALDKKKVLYDFPEENYRGRHPATADLDLRIAKLSRSGKTAVQIAMEIPCSESTVYRALRRVQDFLSSQNYERFLKALRKAIDQNTPSFCDNTNQSVLEMLYAVYANQNDHESAECNAGFLALDELLSNLPLTTTDPVFDKVCALCSCYERSGFTDGFKLGVHMANELST